MNKANTNIIKKYKSLSIRNRFLMLYTLFFLLVSFIVFFEYFINGKTPIWNKDGYSQHVKSAVYISTWMRGLLYNIIKKSNFTPETYTFGIGYGGDIMTTLNYYGFGDIIYLPTLYLSPKVTVYYHIFITYFRFYLSGLSFFALFNYTQKEKGYRVYQPLCGALLYSFSSYAIYGGLKHPQFLIPMIIYPMMILGIEKLLRENKRSTLVLSVFLGSMANFILFYMTAILLIVYFIWRELWKYGIKNWKPVLNDLIKVGLNAILGLSMAGWIIVPVMTMLISDTRTSKSLQHYLLYSGTFIKNFFPGFLSMDKVENYTFLGYGAAGAIIALYLIINRKKHKEFFSIFIALTLFLFLPVFGYIVYATSYAGNRWVWAYTLLICYMTALFLPNIFKLKSTIYKSLVVSAFIYLGICLALDYSLTLSSSFHMIVLFGALSVIGIYVNDSSVKSGRFIPIIAMIITLTSILGNALYFTSYKWRNFSDEAVSFDAFKDNGEFWNTDTDELSSLYTSDVFYRLDGNSVTANSGLLNGVSSTNRFWSTSNSYLNEYRKVMEIGDTNNMISRYYGLDNRTYLTTLSSVYFYKQKEDETPYGFVDSKELRNTKNSFLVNAYSLPLGYGYTNAVSRDIADKLNVVDKERLMINTAIVEDHKDTQSSVVKNDTSKLLNLNSSSYTPELVPILNDIYIDEERIITTDKNASLNIYIDKEQYEKPGNKYEDYLELTNISFKASTKYDLYKGDDKKYDPNSLYGKAEWEELSTKERRTIMKDHIYYRQNTDASDVKITFMYSDNSTITKTIKLHTEDSSWGTNNTDFIINAGVPKDTELTSVNISFPKIGTYTYDSIKLYRQPIDCLDTNYNELKNHSLSDIKLHKNHISHATNKITANYNSDEDTFLFLSIPYSKGWSIYVDGKKQTIVRANIAFMGTFIEKGNHDIELRYETPGLKIGFILSILGIVLFIAIKLENISPGLL